MKIKALETRKKTTELIVRAQRGHFPSTLSCIDIFVMLYYEVMKEEDILIVSKGHANMGLYPILVDKGLIPKEELENYAQPNGMLRMHADPSIPGIEYVGGSLGNGLGYAAGCAFADKNDKIVRKYYVLVGDGELYEGSNWEALLFIGHHKLPITIIVDRNGLAVMGKTEELLALGEFDPEFSHTRDSLYEKFQAFGISDVWEVDGNDEDALRDVFAGMARAEGWYYNRKPHPRALIANTVKGKGLAKIEGDRLWHVKIPKKEELDDTLASIY